MKKTIEKVANIINFSLKVDANSTSTVAAFQPKAPECLDSFKLKK